MGLRPTKSDEDALKNQITGRLRSRLGMRFLLAEPRPWGSRCRCFSITDQRLQRSVTTIRPAKLMKTPVAHALVRAAFTLL